MSFDLGKVNKLQNQIEAMTYDWMLDRATEFYKIEVTADLTESQANEIV